jgi:hypothetical protein
VANRISLIQLEQLVREGNGVSEIARKLKVTKGAISKRLKALNVAVAKDVCLRSAPKLVDNGLDAMAQLRRINGLINKELDQIEADLEVATAEDRKGLQDQKLKHVAEIRKQLGLVLDIAQILYNADEVKAFQEIAVEEIGNVAPEVKHRILQRLNERRLIRSSLQLN